MASDIPQQAMRQVPTSTRFEIVNDRRIVVFAGRDRFALQDTQLAVPFGLLKHLAGSLMSAEGQAELLRMGVQLQTDAQAGKTS